MIAVNLIVTILLKANHGTYDSDDNFGRPFSLSLFTNMIFNDDWFAVRRRSYTFMYAIYDKLQSVKKLLARSLNTLG